MIATVITQKRGVLYAVTRVIAVVCAIASVTLAVYGGILIYAAIAFEHDSLPGPAVLSMVAIAVGLAAVLSGGLSQVLWRVSKRQMGSEERTGNSGRER